LDWNINDNNQLTARYVFHNSSADNLISNSQSAGNGNRRTSPLAMSFKIVVILFLIIRSIVLELNSKLPNSWFNNFIAGYDKQIEDRGLQGGCFPNYRYQNGANTYISAGLDPFTNGNKLSYSTLHFTDNVTKL
jgi:hypothetical protein